ncbi:Hydroxypyruvate isomerase [Luteitalea pratensis]|uniref:Hydroxypyruvate isomerase n=1 Tax=Luteitalea pratensis TaxID=1855912 RepID=A0A143PID1_LUTPR|nr:sugar phosphate isomerase/epimerase family protein [Luteitalea pratensis]AMY07524.1 Hydroxypyruvate isomerase [Luteitalea pratensis]
MLTRRQFLRTTSVATAAVATADLSFAFRAPEMGRFAISLAEWSLHRALFKKEITNIDFPRLAKEHGATGLEYVNQFFKDKAKDTAYLADLKSRAEGLGLKNVLIMIDGEGMLGAPDDAARTTAVENHKPWIDAAKFLGCHAIRVNAASQGEYAEQQKLAADGLRRVGEYGASQGISVIVENHGGLSSNGEWLAGVMKMVGMPGVGTLPDFGNFRISKDVEYDRYKGVSELLPYARGVSAKTHDFDAQGNETHTDYKKMLDLVIASRYRGFIGIEYEGTTLGEPDGVKATKALLERHLQGYL